MTELTPLLMRIPEAARLLGLSRSQCYRLAMAGEIPAVRLGRSVRIHRQLLLEQLAAGAAPRRSA